jgi:hypothetical protein
VDVVFSQSHPRQCVAISIVQDDIPEDSENFTVIITEVGRYEYDELLMRVDNRIGLDLYPSITAVIIEGIRNYSDHTNHAGQK